VSPMSVLIESESNKCSQEYEDRAELSLSLDFLDPLDFFMAAERQKIVLFIGGAAE
jgi:hypothetical protein